jgi:hypothetical protein
MLFDFVTAEDNEEVVEYEEFVVDCEEDGTS